ncbi:MAG TPA: DUF1028 domain-containing protein [Saprospiraceae bacterium]|nr:DUF1028 domain-containing protein [Saprospiraceae bacterium]HND87557.1 DUF1028 domain-containing protein [Saprospiraceae bacterium]
MRRLYSLLLAFTLSCAAFGQDTFSIVAVDSLSGEIGSAGASCLDNVQFPGSNGAIIISNILPGRGAIHTQAAYSAVNQNTARNKMLQGLSPAEIIEWMKTHDANFSPQTRQYGIVDFGPTGNPRSAAFTGTNCLDWKGHRTGANYSIQGNILSGPEILDSMEARFLRATGPLADRLMYALQGANVRGADTRCFNNGTSSLSAFLRVAKPTDPANAFYLSLNVPSLPAGQEPIDSLQTLFDQWKTTPVADPAAAVAAYISPDPGAHQFRVLLEGSEEALLEIFDLHGRLLLAAPLRHGAQAVAAPSLPAGVLLAKISAAGKPLMVRKLVW